MATIKEKQMRIQDYDERRDVVVRFRVTKKERKAIKEMAKKKGLTVSDLLRQKTIERM